MIELIYGHDAEVAHFVTMRLPDEERGEWAPGYKAIGVAVDGQLSCGVVYTEYDGAGIRCSIAAEARSGWASRRTLRALFGYPFVQLGCRRITVLVAKHNERSGRFCLNLGFQVEGVLRHALADDDYIVLGMLRDECKWIKGESHGQEIVVAARA